MIVVGLVADIGWWWIAVVVCGLLIGVLATARARRRELEQAERGWSVGSWRAVTMGLVSGFLLVLGVALAVRALKESVLLPSLTHLRLSERLSLSPSRLSAVMAGVGLASLALGALLLRRARAHARTARASAREDERGADPLPALFRRRCPLRPECSLGEATVLRAVRAARTGSVRGGHRMGARRARAGKRGRPAWSIGGLTRRVPRAPRPGGVARGRGRADGDGRLDRGRHRLHRRARVGARRADPWWTPHQERVRRAPCPPDEIARRWAVTRRSIEQAADRTFIAPVNIAGTFTIRVDPSSGAVSATRADRVDEAGYRAAIQIAFHRRRTPIAVASNPGGRVAL